MIRYGSVCSGIEAASKAWESLGWEAAFFSEIEPFPSAVLAHHYGSNMPGEPLSRNGIPNYGDFTTIPAEAGPVDLLVGGTPCQSFSVAGKRLGLDDPRGNLALEYLALARRLRARWFVWENVPGVLSSRSGDEPAEEGEEDAGGGLESADFATFLSFVRECGYGFAYRVLDAQYVRVDGYARAVPQRRRRVFVVGYLGDWRRAAAVLLEPEGLCGGSPPHRVSESQSASDVNRSIVIHSEATHRDGEPKKSSKRSGLGIITDGSVYTLTKRNPHILVDENGPRRFTPTECERLSGFPDGFTAIPWKGKSVPPDMPRYESIGNSMSVNVMRWIGMRIDLMEKLIASGRIGP